MPLLATASWRSLLAAGLVHLALPTSAARRIDAPPLIVFDAAIAACRAAAASIDVQPSLSGERYGPGGQPLTTLPPLLQRVVATSNQGIDVPRIVTRYPLADGDLWVVTWTVRPVCDIAVTGTSDPAAHATLFAERFHPAMGWETRMARPASPTQPLSAYLFTSWMKERAPDYGVRAKLLAPRPTARSERDVVQMHADFIAGAITIDGDDIRVRSTIRLPG